LLKDFYEIGSLVALCNPIFRQFDVFKDELLEKYGTYTISRMTIPFKYGFNVKTTVEFDESYSSNLLIQTLESWGE